MHLISLLSFIFFTSTAFAQQSLVDQRIKSEKGARESSFAIIPHKPNYILPVSYNNKIKNYDVYPTDDISADKLQCTELKFQISFKMLLFADIAHLPISLFFGYTQVSFWQAYNSEHSSPFRETNYEPEIFSVWSPDTELTSGWNFKLASLHLTHQSNGQREPISRSWNRVEANFVFEKENLALLLTPWYRFEENTENDDNPDLLDYYGHGKISAIYKLNEHTFTIVSRNNVESSFRKGSVEASWSFPLHGKIRSYFQVFSGYGNSLIEYDQYTNTFGIGVSLSDWL